MRLSIVALARRAPLRLSNSPAAVAAFRFSSLARSADATPVERLRDESVLAHIVCPISKFPLRYDAENGRLVCDEIHVAYPIRFGAPMLVPSEAKIIGQEENEEQQ
ncbi:hypothetical protein PybrP1_011230 [[Pythium] brassicae (nom. inval.)]|nr:hypothetical protein PybrP1_011230 [[Pythium] brassicae (nom. inval.)]